MIASPRHLSGIAVVLAGLALVAGCATGTSSQGPTGTATAGNQASSVTGVGSPSSGRRDTQSEFTLEFAKCMRAHGVSNFPDPTGKPGQLGPESGVDPGSQAYLDAINGPCRSLAPPAWVDDGSGSAPRG